MKYLLFICLFFFAIFQSTAQTDKINQIKQKIAQIRKSTNWNNPEEAKKGKDEIQKLLNEVGGPNIQNFPIGDKQQNKNTQKPEKRVSRDYKIKGAVTEENIVSIADRFFKRSNKLLDAVQKNNFNTDYKQAENEKFNLQSARRLTNIGASLITFGNDHNMACVYLATAVKKFPSDTLCINNFGGYLRIIDSIDTSIPVLLYANKLFSESPVILTQLGNSFFELGDFVKAESYYKEAIKNNPDFGQAHSALCDLYIKQNRLQDAIVELFAGVKGMGASYNQASNNFAQIQQQYTSTSSNDEMESKEEFWGEVKKQTTSSDGNVQPPFDIAKLKMPGFPDCQRVEDWLDGGGWANAVQSYTGFHGYMMSSAQKFLEIHKQQPVLPPDAILRDYPNERFALDCITEMFLNFSNMEDKKYLKSIDEITQRVNDAKEIYIKNYGDYAKEYASCIEGCTSEICIQECHREYCSKECPNANKFNDILRQAYKDYRNEFGGMVKRQTKLLDDLYGFTGPWLAKIYSPYWSRIYAYEIKRVALSIVGNSYSAYPQPFQGLAHNDCGEDCSIFLVPFTEKPDDINKKDPDANNCTDKTKIKIPLFFCYVGLDCESVELGCTEGFAGSVKRNIKHKTTTMFVGVGLSANLGVIGAGVKMGGQITVGDDNSVDVGMKMSVSSNLKVPTGKENGVESQMTLSVLGGLNTSTTNTYSTPKINY